jgi:hypothetical protein
MTKTKDPICRSFRQDFPQFVARAEALGVTISLSKSRRGYGRERVFWLDGYKQLTGYTTRSDGSPFTLDDASRNIDTALKAIEEDRAAVAILSVPQRFLRVMDRVSKDEATVSYDRRGAPTQRRQRSCVFHGFDLDGAVHLQRRSARWLGPKPEWCARTKTASPSTRASAICL